MSKTLLYRLFKAGSIPEAHRRTIENEGTLLYDEGIGGSITFRNYRAPGRYSSWRKNWFTGSVVLTHQHILCFAFSKVLVGLSWEEANTKQLEFTLEDGDALTIEYDASLFLEGASGSITLRYKTTLADQMMRKIQELTE